MANIKHVFNIKASAAEVYRAITTQEGLSNWWTNQTIAKPEIGFKNEFRFGEEHFIQMEVVALDENNRVEWRCTDAAEEWIGTQAVFTIMDGEHEGMVTVRFEHNNWPEQSDFYGYCNYSWGWYFTSLKRLLEKGKGVPFPQAAKETTATVE